METYLIWSVDGLYSHAKTMEEAQEKVERAILHIMKTQNVGYQSAKSFGRFEIEKRILSKNELDYLED